MPWYATTYVVMLTVAVLMMLAVWVIWKKIRWDHPANTILMVSAQVLNIGGLIFMFVFTALDMSATTVTTVYSCTYEDGKYFCSEQG